MTKAKTTPILPPAMLGILGGGQLGRMFTVAAKQNEGAVVGNGEAVKRDLRKSGLHGACPLFG